MMASYSRLERKEIIESGSPLERHSLDQHNLKSCREGEKKLFGVSKKQARSLERTAQTSPTIIRIWPKRLSAE